LPKTIAPAYAPLAVAPAYLVRLERTAETPFDAIVEVPRWRRQLALWRWARRH
jgi:hypothetical protein